MLQGWEKLRVEIFVRCAENITSLARNIGLKPSHNAQLHVITIKHTYHYDSVSSFWFSKKLTPLQSTVYGPEMVTSGWWPSSWQLVMQLTLMGKLWQEIQTSHIRPHPIRTLAWKLQLGQVNAPLVSGWLIKLANWWLSYSCNKLKLIFIVMICKTGIDWPQLRIVFCIKLKTYSY